MDTDFENPNNVCFLQHLKGVREGQLESVKPEKLWRWVRESTMERTFLKSVLSWPLVNTGVLCSKEFN